MFEMFPNSMEIGCVCATGISSQTFISERNEKTTDKNNMNIEQTEGFYSLARVCFFFYFKLKWIRLTCGLNSMWRIFLNLNKWFFCNAFFLSLALSLSLSLTLRLHLCVCESKNA